MSVYDQFDFPFHTVETQNPESSFRVQFGNSYVFTTEPDAPDQRIFQLSFQGLFYYTDEQGVVSIGPKPQLSMKALIDFYKAHKLWDAFQYNHPVHGLVVVRFNKPLTEPKAREGGTGFSEPFQIELIEVP